MTFALSKILWFLMQPSNAIALLIVGGLVLSGVLRLKRLGRRLIALGVGLLLVTGFSPLGTALILPLEQRFPVREVTRADDYAGIIVLGGPEDGRNSAAHGQLHLNEAAERITEGARLGRLMPGVRLIFTGGAAIPLLGHTEAAEPVGVWWAAMGIAPDRIVLERRSRNTHENALFVRDMVKPQPGQRWLLVTSAAHMPRSVGVFRRAGFDVVAYPVDFRIATAAELVEPHVALTGGLRRVDDAVREWIGLVAYRLMGRTDALFPAP